MIKVEKQGQEIKIEIMGVEPVNIIESARMLEQIKNLLNKDHNEEYKKCLEIILFVFL